MFIVLCRMQELVPHLVLHQFSRKARASISGNDAQPANAGDAAAENGGARSSPAAGRKEPGSSDSLEAAESSAHIPSFAGVPSHLVHPTSWQPLSGSLA